MTPLLFPLIVQLIGAMILLAHLPAHAGKRVALLVGNAKYSVGALRNPPNDVREMEAALKVAGFQQVRVLLNADQRAMKRAFIEFGDAAAQAEMAFVYYSGHGTQSKGVNYLIPIGAQIQKEADYEVEAVSANELLGQIVDARPGVAIVVLDACRDNPMATTRSGGKGLGRMDAPSGSMIAFATAPNTTASDEGFYAKVLAQQIRTPGLELMDVFRRTSAEVKRLSGGLQDPRLSEVSINEHVYFLPPRAGASAQAQPDTLVASMAPTSTLAPASERPRPASARGKGELQDCDVCPRMIQIGQGKLTVPLPEAKGGNRQLGLGQGLAVGIFEVTFKEWDACAADGGCPQGISDKDWGRDQQPVINVSWHDAKAYTNWLTQKTGHHYRLLREAEWEYVARAGATTEYPWGPDVGIGQANCHQCGADGYSDKQPAPVGRFARNAFGLHDVIGNVWEWTEDCFSPSVASISDKAPDAEAAGNCPSRVLRGGSFKNAAQDAALDRRRGAVSGTRGERNGFRVARED